MKLQGMADGPYAVRLQFICSLKLRLSSLRLLKRQLRYRLATLRFDSE
jgi:hypothetical protein